MPDMATTTQAPDLVVLSHLRWTWVWQRPQHLVSRLAADRARLGASTWFVEEPLEADVSRPIVRTERRDGVVRLWLEVPRSHDIPTTTTGFAHPAARGYGEQVVALLRDHGVRGPDAWVYTPMAAPLLEALRPGRVVYDVMDDLGSFRHAPAGMRERQADLLGSADLVLTGGRSLHEGVLRHREHDVHLFPSGVETAHYAAARALRTARRTPVAGYVGVIDERVDLDLVRGLAERLPGWRVRLVGPSAKIDPADLPRADNIDYTGMVSYADLPEVMAGFDVALMPFALNEATRSISPTKTLEYLAAGLPVLSTRVPDVVATYEGVVHLADDAAGFAAGCEEVLLDPATDRDALAAPLLRRQEWDTIAAEMARLLAAVPPRMGTLGRDVVQAHRLGLGAALDGLSDARRSHLRSGGTCPTCGTPAPCRTAEALA